MARPPSKRRRSPARRALLVANPAAQGGRNQARIALAREQLDRAGIAHDFLATAPGSGRTAALVREALSARACRLVIAMGGDGTLSEVARGLMASGRAREIPLGLLPTGTANDLGRSFGLTCGGGPEIERNVAVLAAGAETDLDAGLLFTLDENGEEAQQELFVDSVGFGLGPRILRQRNQERRWVEGIPLVRELYRGQLVYAASALRALGESYLVDDKFDVEVVADGVRRSWKGLNDLVVKGPRIYAGHWVLDPHSKPDDGRFEVVPFAGRRDWLSKALLFLDHTGTFGEDLEELGVRHSRGLSAARLELALRPRRPGAHIPAQVDGEEHCSVTRVRVEVLPRALRLVVPGGAAGRPRAAQT
ncbi:MAG: hypothetical protein HY901_01370 [Deltaproteobacteria bacterium]|nr:hypothetical protein [Deltaproteobacteria bacterium]